MVKSKVYTKSGDKGQTSLVGGQRVSKSDQRIDLYGDVDELNSQIGMVTASLKENEAYISKKNHLQEIQALLFDLGSNLACEVEQRASFKLPQLSSDSVVKLESEIDEMDLKCPTLKTFILPGGSIAAASCHVCRTICRRVERKLIHFSTLLGEDELPENCLEFINRLSDYFFVLSRYLNVTENVEEVLWIAQKN